MYKRREKTFGGEILTSAGVEQKRQALAAKRRKKNIGRFSPTFFWRISRLFAAVISDSEVRQLREDLTRLIDVVLQSDFEFFRSARNG